MRRSETPHARRLRHACQRLARFRRQLHAWLVGDLPGAFARFVYDCIVPPPCKRRARPSLTPSFDVLEDRTVPSHMPGPFIAAGSGTSGKAKFFDATTGDLQFAVNPFGQVPVRVAVADLNHDGQPDMLVTGDEGPVSVVGYDNLTGDQIFDLGPIPDFDTGAFLAAADWDGDGMADVAVGSDAGGPGLVRIYSGVDGALLNEYAPFGSNNDGAVRVALGDVTGDERPDLVLAPGHGHNIKVIDGATGQMWGFRAYGTFNGGAFVTVGDVNHDGTGEVIVGKDAGAKPVVKIFSGQGVLFDKFFAYETSFRGGVRVGSLYVDSDDHVDIVTAPGPGMAPIYHTYSGATLELLDGPSGTFQPFPSGQQEGSWVAGGNDPLPTISISDVTKDEGQTGTTTFQFTVTLSSSSMSFVSVAWATVADSATANSDYLGAAGNVFFNPGVTVASAVVTVYGDTEPEPTEHFFVNLSSPFNATIADGQAIGTITNDDIPNIPITVECSTADVASSPVQAGSVTGPGGVRYFDGAVSVGIADLSSEGFGMPWGNRRSWSNGPGYASGLSYGSGWVVSDLPRLVLPSSTVLVLVSNGTTARYFDRVESSWNWRHYEQAELTDDLDNDEIVLTDIAGNVIRFYDFSTSNPADRRGTFKSFTDAQGNTISVTEWEGDLPEEVQRSNTTGGTTVTESLLYAYSGGLVSSVTLRRKIDSGDWVTVRKSEYTFYDGSTESGNGLAGDLRSVVIKDASNNVLDTHYYRYYTADTGTGYAHGLKYAFSPDSYARLVAALGSSVGSLTDSQIDDYADLYLEYDAARRVTKQVVQGAGCSACTGGLGTYTYSYTTSTHSPGYNNWKVRTVETLPDSNQNIVYTNYYGEVMLSTFKDVTTEDEWITFNQYEGAGRLILTAGLSAVTGYDDDYADLLHEDSGDFEYLSDSTGLVATYSYYGSTTATESTAGGAYGYLQEVNIQKGETGTAIPQQDLAYFKRTAGGADVFPVATQTVYRNTDGTGGQTTSYAYTWYSGTTQIESMTVTYPTVTTAQNGPNSADTETTFFDTYGRPVWTKDGDGFLTFRSYDQATGALTKWIGDVDTDESGDFTGLPSGWETPAAGGLHLTQTMEVDTLGRTTKLTDPNGNITYTVYLDSNYEVRVYAGWDDTNDRPTGPTQVYRQDRPGSYYETLTMTATPSVTNDRPTGAESVSGVQTLSRQYTNSAGQVVSSDAYFNLSGLTYSTSTTLGTENTHYYRTRIDYTHRGWQNRVVSPTGTIYRTVYDALGRPVSEWVGTNDTPGSGSWSPTNNTSPSNMVKVREYVYDGGEVGDGNLTKVTDISGGGADNRVQEYYYDWRDRQVASKGGVQGSEGTGVQRPIYYRELDNLGQVIATEQYDGDNVSVTDGNSDGVPDKPSSSLLRARSTASYDERGRVYRTQTYSINQSNGDISTYSLNTDYWRNDRGQVIKTASPGGLVSKAQYDGAGRVTKAFTTDGGSDSGWSDADDVTGDIVLEQVEYDYDDNGNVLLTTYRQRFHDETDTGELGTPSSGVNARVSYSAAYYDMIYRLTASVDVGTNAGSAYTRPGTVPSRSDTVLVTSYEYNDSGWLEDTTDPRGIVMRSEYDNLGRTVRTIEAYTDGTPTDNTNKTVEMGYDGSSHVVTYTLVLPDDEYQTTAFVYGVTTGTGSAVSSNDILAATKYPDKSTGDPSNDEKETYTVNGLGQRVTFTDRNGTVHTYSYDVLGRMTTDSITTLGDDVDDAVLRIEYAYDTGGRAYLFTTYDDDTGGNIVNQVQRDFNGLGQLITEYQSHSGAVNTETTPKVQYGYSEMSGGANHSRLTTMTYPNDRVLNYNYASGLDSNISRLSSILDSSATLEGYAYLGLGTVVQRSHAEPGIELTYIKQSGESNGDGGDQYTGLDRFGRIVDQRWRKTSDGSHTDRFQYGYDRNGNRLYRDNLLSNDFDELYHANGASNGYDQLNQLTDFRRGALSDTNADNVPDTVTTASRTQSWQFDAAGNWTTLTTDSTDQDRTANAQNQITSIDGLTTPAYDANGNTTTDEQGNTLIYDAWNFLVEVQDGMTSLATYGYDALHRRVTENPGTSRDLYYSSEWQVLEERVSGTAKVQYVWSPAYVDALIARDRDADANAGNGLEERLYAQQDANWNVTGVVSTSGSVLERYISDPYGSSTVRAPDWSSRSSSSYDWTYVHQANRYDTTTGQYYVRNRTYSPTLGNWMQIDPIGFEGGDSNLYLYVANNPVNLNDPLGLRGGPVAPPIGPVIRPGTRPQIRPPRLHPWDSDNMYPDPNTGKPGNPNANKPIWPVIRPDPREPKCCWYKCYVNGTTGYKWLRVTQASDVKCARTYVFAGRWCEYDHAEAGACPQDKGKPLCYCWIRIHNGDEIYVGIMTQEDCFAIENRTGYGLRVRKAWCSSNPGNPYPRPR